VRCRNCGHENPEQNRFCGMCGKVVEAPQTVEPEYLVEKVPISVERAGSKASTEVPPTAEPVEPRRETVNVAPSEPARRSDKWWVDEGETTVGGPSFLGLSHSGSGEGGYSYLFEEEERSHAGLWVFLVLLLVLSGVVYAKWQPIRDYVLTTALTHARPQQPPAQDSKSEQNAVPGSSAPTTTLASSDAASQPAITTETKADTSKVPPQKEGLPEQDNAKDASGAPKPDENAKSNSAGKGNAEQPASKQPSAKSQAAKDQVAKDQAPASEEDSESASAAEEEKPAKNARALPVSNPGSDLVNSGEKYLYGRGVARSCDQAVSYFNAAAAKQNPQAFSHLGALYATGECVPMDRAVAYAWFRRAYAKEPTNHYFEQNLTMLWREMTPDERQRATGSKVARF
jgi:hypothetical protein